jgi:hypothetical protein
VQERITFWLRAIQEDWQILLKIEVAAAHTLQEGVESIVRTLAVNTVKGTQLTLVREETAPTLGFVSEALPRLYRRELKEIPAKNHEHSAKRPVIVAHQPR